MTARGAGASTWKLGGIASFVVEPCLSSLYFFCGPALPLCETVPDLQKRYISAALRQPEPCGCPFDARGGRMAAPKAVQNSLEIGLGARVSMGPCDTRS